MRVALPPLPPKLIVPFWVPAAKALAFALTETLTPCDELAARLPLDGENVSQAGPVTLQLSVPLPVFCTM